MFYQVILKCLAKFLHNQNYSENPTSPEKPLVLQFFRRYNPTFSCVQGYFLKLHSRKISLFAWKIKFV